MKLRNRKTGEIVEFRYLQSDHVAPLVLTTYENDKPMMYSYNSLTELNAEWEDYEEPKECCFVSEFGKVYSLKNIPMDKERIGWLKQIGNYFDTREEAEKAVEKLKAWKRLKDKGFKFKDWKEGTTYCLSYEWNEDIKLYEIDNDLDLLFSGGGE